MNNIITIALNDDTLKLTPAETVAEMFECTDENGVLYIPEWTVNESIEEAQRIFRCVMDWTASDAEKITGEHSRLVSDLSKIAGRLDDIFSNEDAKALPEDLQAVWNTYLRDFETGDMDPDKIGDISDRLETVNYVEYISEKLDAGKEVSDEEINFYEDYRDEAVSDEERGYAAKYRDLLEADSARRIGQSAAAYYVILRARRLAKLMSIHAPELILNMESCRLAEAMALHGYCISMESAEQK